METGYPYHEQILDGWLLFVLVLLRMGSLAVFAPFFGSEVFLARARLLLAAGLSIIFWPAAAFTADLPQSATELGLLVLASREVALGLTLGFLSSVVIGGLTVFYMLASRKMDKIFD